MGIESLIGLAAPIIGGLLSGGDKNGGAGTTNKEPWGPSQDWLKSNIATGQKLQDYYQQNPFNPQQKTSYENLFGDLNNFRSNTAPGLMGFANRQMTTNYQRQRGGAPGSGGGYGGAVQQAGNQSNGQARPFSVYQGQSGPDGTPSSQYAPINWDQQNPFFVSPEEQARLAKEAADKLKPKGLLDTGYYNPNRDGLIGSGI